MALWASWTSLGLALLRNPAGRAGTQPTGCLSAPARTFAAPPPWGWLGGFWTPGVVRDALSTIRCGAWPPSQPMRSEKRHPFRSLPNHSIPSFCSSSRTSAAQRRENRVPSAAVRRKHVIWAPLGELRALVEVRMHELLWLPRSARRADGDETRSRAKSGEQVVEQIARDFLLLILCTQIAPTRR